MFSGIRAKLKKVSDCYINRVIFYISSKLASLSSPLSAGETSVHVPINRDGQSPHRVSAKR
jgi:hypothetical protein